MSPEGFLIDVGSGTIGGYGQHKNDAALSQEAARQFIKRWIESNPRLASATLKPIGDVPFVKEEYVAPGDE